VSGRRAVAGLPGRCPVTAARELPAGPAGADAVAGAEAVAAAGAAAARALRSGRMPRLGSVRHGSAVAALRGCPCLPCERLRAALAEPAPAGSAAAAAEEAGTEAGAAGPVRGWFGPGHPLAGAVRRRCRRVHGGGQAGAAGVVGQVGCGQCWEQAVRADERLAVVFDLPADPPPTDRDYVDPVALERAAFGERVRLTDADRAEIAGRVYAGRLPWQVVKRLGLSGGRVRAAAASARPGDGAR